MLLRVAILPIFLISNFLCEDAPEGMISVEGGSFLMGAKQTDPHATPDERPQKKATVAAFFIDETPVTNQQFREYVRATKHKTEAEGPPPEYGWSFVLTLDCPEDLAKKESTRPIPGQEHWLAVEGAYWRQPRGPGSSITDRLDHPVVHVSWKDAKNYCTWAGKRLATEKEWEFAARGGVETEYPWGEKADVTKFNFWQGKFPTKNTEKDGYMTTSPVKKFPPNNYGIYDMIGNVWEWVNNKYSSPDGKGPGKGQPSNRVLRGGSFVDSKDGKFNHKARITTRMGNTPDSSAQNTGFRCAKSPAHVKRDEL